MHYSIINYSHHAIHYIPMTYFFYNWKPVPFDSLQIFCVFIYSNNQLNNAVK